MKTKRVSYLISTGTDSSAECVCFRLFPFFHHKYLNLIIGQLRGGGVHPDYSVKLDFEIAVDQQTWARDRTFEGVPDSG